MNDFMKQMTTHRSIRTYKPDPIPEELLKEILQCGLRGSSSGNIQSWSVITTTDKKNKERLYEIHLEQEMVLEAPLVLTFCADFFRMREWVRINNSKQSFDDFMGFMVGAVDAVIAAQNIALAAESKGLGICYMGTTLMGADKIIDLFELPKCVFPVTSLVVGYPNENPEVRDRLPLEAIVHTEKYQKKSEEELLALHKDKEMKTWARYNSFPDLAKKLKDAGIEKVTDFYTSEFKYSKKMHQRTAELLIQKLQDQHFFT